MTAVLEVKFSFTEGETSATRRYTLKETVAGVLAAKDLTSFTAVNLYATRQGPGTDVGPISGSFVSPRTGGQVDFDHTSIAAVRGSYYCEIELTDASGVSFCQEAFLTPVRPRASDMDL